MDEFGERLKKLRKQAGITQQELAEILNVHPQTVSKWERGISEPDMAMYGQLADVLGVSLEELFGTEGCGGRSEGRFDIAGLGSAILAARKKCGESQGDAARALGVAAGTVSKWERGIICPDIKNLLALSKHFGVAPSALYYSAQPVPSPEVSAGSPGAVIAERKGGFRLYAIIFAAFLIMLAAALILWLVPDWNFNVTSAEEDLPAHTHSYSAEVISPTCTTGGYTIYTCGECNEGYVGDYTAATGHAAGGWSVYSSATCTEQGEERRYCSDCGTLLESRATAALEHSFSAEVTAPTCSAQGFTTFGCDMCGYSYAAGYTAATGHAAGERFVVSSPTCTRAGENRRCCKVCGAVVESRTVAKLEHDYLSTIVQPANGDMGYTLHECKNCDSAYRDNFFTCAFSEGLEYSPANGGYSVAGMGNCTDTNIIIPEYIDGNPVVAIENGAFKNCTSLKSVELPQTIASIGAEAFFGCAILTEIELPDSLAEIGASAFASCGIESIRIPCGVEEVSERAFTDCAFLESVTFEYGVKSINYMAFYRCESLVSLNLPDSITFIDDEAFCGCRSLTSVELPSHIAKIGYSTFSDCVSLQSVAVPEGVTIIDDLAFNNCRSLSVVTLPRSLKTIGGYAFNGNYSLRSIVIPASVENIGDNAFLSCSSLEDVIFADAALWHADGAGISEEELLNPASAACLLTSSYAKAMWKKY